MEQQINKQDENYIIDYHLEILKIVIYSLVGIFVFFIPVNLNGQSLTLIYHISYKLQRDMGEFLKITTIIYLILGFIKPIIINKNKNLNLFFYVKLFSIFIIINVFYLKTPIILLDNNALLVIEDLILNLITIFPISAIFITFLLDYGLLDIVESYTQKSMKKIFNISGKTLVNILVYFFTDFFCGAFMTNKLYTTGKIREKEACILILTFSILSFNMVKYICEELNLSTTTVFIITLVVLIISNIVQCRIYPLNKKKKSYHIKSSYKETIHKSSKLEKAIKKYIQNKTNKNVFKEIINNFEESIMILMKLIPNIVLVLYLGQIIVNNDLIIEICNLLFNPIIEIFKIYNGNEVTSFIINLFYSPILAVDILNNNIQDSTKLLIGILGILSCVSAHSMIYIKNTDINISKKEFLISHIQRILIIIFLYFIMYYFYKGYII